MLLCSCHHCPISRTLPSSQTDTLSPLDPRSPPRPPAPGNLTLLSVSVDSAPLGTYASRSAQHLSFCDWLISLGVTSPRFAPLRRVSVLRSFSRLRDSPSSRHSTFCSPIICPGPLGWLLPLAVAPDATVSRGEHRCLLSIEYREAARRTRAPLESAHSLPVCCISRSRPTGGTVGLSGGE